jgi:hypothetical protein
LKKSLALERNCWTLLKEEEKMSIVDVSFLVAVLFLALVSYISWRLEKKRNPRW